MKTFELTLIDGNPIIEANDQVILVDTGNPKTFSKTGNLTFMDRDFHVSKGMIGCDLEIISNMVGKPIDVMLGMDIISKFSFLFDYQNKKLTIAEHIEPIVGYFEAPISTVLGTILLHLDVNGNSLKMALDTGARISYLNSNYTDGMTATETRSDYHPNMGNFETPIYPVETGITENEKFIAKFGVLPKAFEMALSMIGVKGVIGYDLLNNYQVLIDLPNNRLYLKRNQ